MLSRRRLLLGTALGGGTATLAFLAAAGTARAFSVEEVPATSGIGLALSNRCGGDGDEHARLADGLRARLAAGGARHGETASVTCPICGCPVTASAP